MTVPDEYEADETRRWPMILFLHGGGTPKPELFTKSVVIAGVCHPWSLRHYPKIPVWVFVGADDYMRKEQQQTVTSAKRFGVDVVETVWKGADHGGIFRNAMSDKTMLEWLMEDQDLRSGHKGGQ